MRATMVTLMLCWGLSLPAAAETADAPYPVATQSARVESLNFADSTLIAGGLRYAMALDADVEIGGSYGAFTMLKPGMRIYFEYLVISPSERRIVLIRELPADVRLEET